MLIAIDALLITWNLEDGTLFSFNILIVDPVSTRAKNVSFSIVNVIKILV